MHNLETLIRLAKENDENAMLDIIEKFQPLINKYFKKSMYDEDVKSAIILKLIEVVKLDLKFEKFRKLNEGTIVNYIISSLKRYYFVISNKNNTKFKSEIIYEDDIMLTMHNPDKIQNEKDVEDVILFEMLRTILTKREYDCVYHIVFMGYTAEELSKKMKITKQACNQCKKRAFAKIREFCINQGN